ncbi:MAG: hypothetical protein ABI867_22100 [Kofleriaceae bacterium]
MLKALLFGVATLTFGCATDKTDIGDATVGAITFHIFREGPAATAGADTTLVLKSTAGGNPTSIVGWVGLETADDSTKVDAVFDSGDGDYDIDITCPDPLPAGSQFWFTVDDDGAVETGMIDLK